MAQYKTVLDLFQNFHPLIYASQFVQQQFEYLEKKELFTWNKKFFIVFEGLLFGEKTSNSRQELS